ncbi:hypothetical protein AgCh_003063 [Apium graveolens]
MELVQTVAVITTKEVIHTLLDEAAATVEEAVAMEEDTAEAAAIITATVGVALQLKRQHLRPLKLSHRTRQLHVYTSGSKFENEFGIPSTTLTNEGLEVSKG